MQEWHFILVRCIKMLTVNINNDKKKHKAKTIEGKAQNKETEATKSIFRAETNRISTRMLKCKRLNRMCLVQNLEQQLASLERAQKELSNNIKKSKIGDRKLKIRLPECKIEHLALTSITSNQTESKLKNTCTNISILEPAFWRFFWIGKIPPYAKVMAKKPQVGPKPNRRRVQARMMTHR